MKLCAVQGCTIYSLCQVIICCEIADMKTSAWGVLVAWTCPYGFSPVPWCLSMPPVTFCSPLRPARERVMLRWLRDGWRAEEGQVDMQRNPG